MIYVKSKKMPSESKPDNYQINAKICALVERYPCMYDRAHPNYLKKDVIDKAWVKIAKEMDDSIPSCKERWRNIRTSFARSINVNKIPASANRTKPYYLHEELQFLARHITPGIPVSRRSNNNNSNSYYSAGEESEVIEVSVSGESFDGFAAGVQEEEESQDQLSSVDEKNDLLKIKAQLQQPQEDSRQCQQNATPEPQQQPQVQMELDHTEAEVVRPSPLSFPPKKRQCIMNIEQINMEQERDVKPFPSSEQTQESDFDAMFLQGLLPEMKAMDFRQKLLFKRRIYEVVSEIFENEPQSTTNRTYPTMNFTTSTPQTANATAPPAMTVVNSADLTVIRRLNCLLQGSNVTAAPCTVTAVPKNGGAMSSASLRSPAPATVAVHRGALTRSTSNLLRVLVNPSTCTSSPVKQEPEVLDD